MLDNTADRLKMRLAEGFDAWQKQSPKLHTKAEFARLCSQVAGRPCSPQTVGSWFKTGRMDKAWLPVVEQVLGASLGFSHAPALPAPDEGELLSALQVVASAIRPTTTIVRDALVPTFSNLVRSPEDVGTIAQTIQNLLGSAPRQASEPENGARSPITARTNIAEQLGRHGQRNRISAGKK